jgi:uncharacterized protein (UPF0276 family)
MIFAGVGLGLRRDFIDDLASLDSADQCPDFLEIAPENWMGFGGQHANESVNNIQCFVMAYRYPLAVYNLLMLILLKKFGNF